MKKVKAIIALLTIIFLASCSHNEELPELSVFAEDAPSSTSVVYEPASTAIPESAGSDSTPESGGPASTPETEFTVQAIEDFLFPITTLFSDFRPNSLISHASVPTLNQAGGLVWFNRYGKRIPPPDFIIGSTMPTEFRLYDFENDGIPEILIYYWGINRGGMSSPRVYRFINGEFLYIGHLAPIPEFFTDSVGQVITLTSAAYCGCYFYERVIFGDYGLERELLADLSWNTWDEGGYEENMQEWWAHHAEPYFSQNPTVFGHPEIALAPLLRLTELEEQLTENIRYRHGLHEEIEMPPNFTRLIESGENFRITQIFPYPNELWNTARFEIFDASGAHVMDVTRGGGQLYYANGILQFSEPGDEHFRWWSQFYSVYKNRLSDILPGRGMFLWGNVFAFITLSESGLWTLTIRDVFDGSILHEFYLRDIVPEMRIAEVANVRYLGDNKIEIYVFRDEAVIVELPV